MKTLAGRPRDTEDVARVVLRQGDAFDWEYVLHTARELQEAIGQEVVPQLERLRRSNE